MMKSLLLLLIPAVVAAQTTPRPVTASPSAGRGTAPTQQGRTTLSGVYTLEEAEIGKEMYEGLCASCHKVISHTGPTFRRKWAGRPLSDLFLFMRLNMPKNDPGSLADEDYAVLLAYMLRMNEMPPGKTYLSTDTLELRKIRIDTVTKR